MKSRHFVISLLESIVVSFPFAVFQSPFIVPYQYCRVIIRESTYLSMVVFPTADFCTDGRLRKRKSGLTKADDFKNAKKVVSFDVQLEDSVVTDFNKEDAYQSCAVFSPDGSLLATAGADGHIRMWKV